MKFKQNLRKSCLCKKVLRLLRKKQMLEDTTEVALGVIEALSRYQVRTPTEARATDVGRAILVGNMVILLLVVLIPRGF